MSICLPDDCYDDPRVLSLSDGQYRKWMGLCRLAARGRVRGRIPAYPGAGLARALRTQQHHLGRALDVLTALELVERLEGGALWVTLFDHQETVHVPEPEIVDERTAGARRQERFRESRKSGVFKSGALQDSPTVTLPGLGSVTRYGQQGVTRNGSHNGNGAAKSVTEVSKSVTEVSKSVTNGVTPPRARQNVERSNVSEDKEIAMLSSSSRDVSDVEAGVTPVTPPSVTPPPPEAGIPPVRRIVHERDARKIRLADVTAVVTLTGDDDDRGRWVALWNHCHGAGRLDLWDKALKIIARKMGAGEIETKAEAYMDRTLRNMLSNEGCPAPENPARVADIRAQIRQSLATADAQEGPAQGGDHAGTGADFQSQNERG